MRDRADEVLPCNRPSTLRQAQGPQGQGPPFDPSTLRPFDKLRDRRAQGPPFDELRDRPSTGAGDALNCLVD